MMIKYREESEAFERALFAANNIEKNPTKKNKSS